MTTPTTPTTGHTRTTAKALSQAALDLRHEVGGERAGRLLVRTTAAPVDDAANAAVRRLVAAHLDVPLRRVEIVSGHHSRDKVISVTQ